MKIFFENKDGVHLMAAIEGEHAVCGDAWDIGTEPDEEDMVKTKKVVTCHRCIAEIKNCRGVKVAEPCLESELTVCENCGKYATADVLDAVDDESLCCVAYMHYASSDASQCHGFTKKRS